MVHIRFVRYNLLSIKEVELDFTYYPKTIFI